MEEATVLQVWDHNNQDGYVFISSGYRTTAQKSCDKGTWVDKPFKWPEQRDEIIPYIKSQDDSGRDVYWCPHVFHSPARKTENALPVKCLHSDLDEALPPKEFPPTYLWESSPNRYAAVWYLDKHEPVDMFEAVNQDFNYSIGADKNCWTVTKVLRIPGCTNHKYPNKPKVKLLMNGEKKTYKINNFIDVLEPRVVVEAPDDMDDIQISQPLFKLISKYSDVLTKDMIMKLMMSDSDVNSEFADRSGVLFSLEHDLYKTGIPIPEIIELLRNSGLNKFRDRRDEQRCWEREFEKVSSHIGKVKPAQEKFDRQRPEVLSLANRMARNLTPPGWLIEGFWPVGSHGIIAGPPKSYKSILVMEMAISIATGTSLFGMYAVPNQGTVLYVQNENPEWSVDDRIHKMLAYKGIDSIVEAREVAGKIEFVEMPIPFYSVDYNFNLNDEADKEWLEKTVQEYKPKMVILDSLYMMMSGVDENSMKEVAPMMNWLLHSLAKKYNTAVVVLHHWNKNSKGDRATRMLGSQAFRAWVDSQINAQTEEDEDHTVTFYREFPRSYGTLSPVKIKFTMGEPGNDLYIPTIIVNDDGPTKSEQNIDVRNDIFQRLESGPKTLAELQRGLDNKMVSQELAYLKAKGHVKLVHKKYEYTGGRNNE